MALTRITKGVIKPNENYDTHNINSTGIVTAIGLDVNGNGDISGNLSVGGVLTYEDVTSIDSVGIITAQKDIHVGAGVSAVGVGTFGSLDIGGDIDVDGHTNLDNVSIAGVTTTNTLHVAANNTTVGAAITQSGSGDILKLYDGTSEVFTVANQDDGVGAVTISSPKPRIVFNETNGSPDYQIRMNGGIFTIHDSTNDIGRISITSTRTDINNPVLLNNDTVWIGDKLVHWTDDDTAIRFPAANTFSVETGGSERLRVDPNGRVTIGISANAVDNVFLTIPRLQSTGDAIRLISQRNDTAPADLSFVKSRSTTYGSYTATQDDDFVMAINSYIDTGSALSYRGTFRSIYDTSTGGVHFQWGSGTAPSSSGEKMRLTSGGNLGINESSPSQRLHVGGDVQIGFNTPNDAGRQINFNVNRSSAGDTLANINWQWNNKFVAQIRGMAGSDTTNKDDAHLVFYTSSANNLSARLRIHPDGGITIGDIAATTTKAGILHTRVSTTTRPVVFENDTENSDVVIKTTGTNKHSILGFGDGASNFAGNIDYDHQNNSMVFDTNGGERLNISSAGVITQVETGTGNGQGGIKASTASAGGNAGFGFITAGSQRFSVTTIGSAGSESLRVYDVNNSAERLRITSVGHLGLGMTPDTWHTNNQKVFQISGTNAGLNIFTRAGSAHLSSNFIYNSSDAGVYQAASGYAMHHAVSATNGTFDWFSSSAASSSAGSSATLINRLRITQSGKVGINQDNPSTILHVKHTNNNTADITIEGGGTGNAGLQLIPGGQTNKYFCYVDTNRNFRIQDHTAERLRILAGGKVLIGNGNYYTPQGMLHIVGDDNSNGPELYLMVGNNNVTDNIGALIFGNNIDKTVCMIRGSTHTATNTGDIEFHTSESGTLSEKLRIKNNGQVNFVRRNQANPFPAGNGTFTGISLDTDGGDIATGRIYIQGYQKNANSDYLTGFNNEGSTLVLYDYANTHYKQKWHKNGGTELYFTTTNRLETTSTGVDITGILDISVTKDTTALIIDGATSGTAYGETGGRIDFKMRNQVNQLTGDPAARVASYLDRGNNGFGLRFSTRYDASTFVNMVQISADYEFEPCLDSTVNLGSEDRTWNNAYIKDMYPDHSNESAMSGNYTAGSWYSTGFYRDNMGGLDTNGTYIVTCFSDTYAAGGGNYSTTTTWIVGVRDQYSNQTQVDSVPRLSTTAHSTNGQYFDLATRRYPSSSYSGREELVWKSNSNMTNINNNGGRLIRFRVQRIGRSST